MSVMNKLLALLTCLVIICGCLVSCGNETPDTGNEQEGNTNVENENNDGENNVVEEPEELPCDKYVATVKIVYATTDWKMKEAIDAINNQTTLISVDGENIKIESEVEIDDMSSASEYVCIDNKLYYSTTLSVGEIYASDYKVADVSENNKYDLLNKVGAGVSIGAEDFGTLEEYTSGKFSSSTCTGISDEAKASLSSLFSSKLALLGATVEIANATYYFETIDGRIDNSTLSCDFVILMDGQEYTITAHISYTYDYDAEVSITVPAEADKYTVTSLDNII